MIFYNHFPKENHYFKEESKVAVRYNPNPARITGAVV